MRTRRKRKRATKRMPMSAAPSESVNSETVSKKHNLMKMTTSSLERQWVIGRRLSPR